MLVAVAAVLLLHSGPAVAPRPSAGGADLFVRLPGLLRCLMLMGFVAGSRGLDSASPVLASPRSALASGTAIMGCSQRVEVLESEQMLAAFERQMTGFAGNYPQVPAGPGDMLIETLPQHQAAGDASGEAMQAGFWGTHDPHEYEYGPEYCRGRPPGRKQHHKCEHLGCSNFAG